MRVLWNLVGASRLPTASRKKLLFGTALFLMLLLTACNGQPTTPNSTNNPKSGGTLNVRVTSDPFDWDLTDRGKSQPMNGGQPLGYSSLLGFKSASGLRYDEPGAAQRPE